MIWKMSYFKEKILSNYKCFVNGHELKVNRDVKLIIPSVDLKSKDIFELERRTVQGSLDVEIELNPLWKRQQETGIPKRVHLSYLCNLN